MHLRRALHNIAHLVISLGPIIGTGTGCTDTGAVAWNQRFNTKTTHTY